MHFLKRSALATRTQLYLQTSHICLYCSAAEHHCRLAGTHFTVPRRLRLSRPGWLVIYGNKVTPPLSNQDTVTRPSVNRVRRRLTSLIKTNALPLPPNHQPVVLRPNSITLSGRRQVLSWSQTCSELEFGPSSSSLAAS